MADPEGQNIPFAPAGVKSDEPPYTTTGKPIKLKHQKQSKFLVYVLAAVVIQSTILLIIASVFLRVTKPDLRLSSVVIQNLQYETVNLTSLNMTLLAQVTVDNENFGRYDFENCAAVILYGNSTIGGGDISGGRIRARKTEAMNLTMDVRSENLNISNGGGGNSIELVEITSYAQMTGRVRVTKIVNRRKTIEMNCTMNVNLTSRSITSLLC